MSTKNIFVEEGRKKVLKNRINKPHFFHFPSIYQLGENQ